MTSKMVSFFPELEFYLDICPFSDYSMASSLKECFEENEKSLDVKTLRKVLNGQEVSLRTVDTFRQGLEEVYPWLSLDGLVEECASYSILDRQWCSFVKGLKLSTSGQYLIYFVHTAQQLLEDHRDQNNQVKENRLTGIQIVENLIKSAYWRRLLPFRTISGLAKEDIQVLMNDLKNIVIYASISPFLRLMAAMELDFQKTFNLKSNISLVKTVLPTIENGNIVYPLKHLTDDWKKDYTISIKDLSETMPTSFGTNWDNRARKLKQWREGKYCPKVGTIYDDETLDWIKSFTNSLDSDDIVSIEWLRFEITCRFQRLIVEMLKHFKKFKEYDKEDVAIVEAFSSYARHYNDILENQNI